MHSHGHNVHQRPRGFMKIIQGSLYDTNPTKAPWNHGIREIPQNYSQNWVISGPLQYCQVENAAIDLAAISFSKIFSIHNENQGKQKSVDPPTLAWTDHWDDKIITHHQKLRMGFPMKEFVVLGGRDIPNRSTESSTTNWPVRWYQK